MVENISHFYMILNSQCVGFSSISEVSGLCFSQVMIDRAGPWEDFIMQQWYINALMPFFSSIIYLPNLYFLFLCSKLLFVVFQISMIVYVTNKKKGEGKRELEVYSKYACKRIYHAHSVHL